MMKKVGTIVKAETKNNLYKEGYRFLVDGDYRTKETIDPWSGMPDTERTWYAFTEKKEAEAFAEKQIWVFNNNIHADVTEIPEHTETMEERLERREREKAEAKAKRKAREEKKAAEAGMTLEEYKEAKRKAKRLETLKAEIANLKKELEEKEALLKKLEG